MLTISKTRLKRKVAVIDDDSEPDVDLYSFSKKLVNKSFAGKGKGKEVPSKCKFVFSLYA